jgi:protease-4
VGLRISGQKHRTVMTKKRYVPVELRGKPGPREVVALVLALERLENDPAVSGVLLEPRGFAAPTGALQDLRQSVERLREAGKHVACHADEATSAAYYLCTAADTIYLGPAGGVRLSGYKMRIMFYTGLLEKLGVNAQFVKIGEYKSYPERFTLKSPSAPAMEQYTQLLEEVWAQVVADVAAGRSLEVEEASSLLEEGPYNAEEAVSLGLADALAYPDEVKDMLEEETGGKVLLDRKYWKIPVKPEMWSAGKKKVAVLVVGGSIVEGKSRSIPGLGIRMAGDETLVKALDMARKDPTIGALVLRVESGGGSALASDRIWRAVHRLGEKKPVVASIGGVAASGGYYLLAPATEVYASPSSVTGSIGIFYGKADLSGLLEKVGVDVTVIHEGGDKVDMDSWYRPYTPEEVAFIEKELTYFYNLFLARVGAGRGMTRQEVDEVGRGRVYTGLTAQDLGLVDRVAGLPHAIDRARELGSVPAWVPVVDITPGQGLLEKIVGKFVMQGQEPVMELASMLARAAGVDDVYTLATFLLREEEIPIAVCPLALEL